MNHPPVHVAAFRLAPLCLLAAGAPACSGFNLDSAREPAPIVAPAPVVEVDPCEGVSSAAVSRIDPSSAAALACGAESLVPFEAAVEVFDTWDGMVAAAAVIRCAESDACDATRPAGLGLFAFAAELLEPSRELAAAAGLDAALAERFAARLDAARLTLAERAAALDAIRQEIYVDLPEMVHSEFGMFSSTFGEFGDRLATLTRTAEDELQDGDPTAETSEALRQLRADYVADCVARSGLGFDECVGGPIARPATRTLLHLAAAGDDPVSARVELELLETIPDRSTVMAAIAVRQAERRTIASSNYAAAQRAISEGAAADDVAELYGPTADAAADPPLPWTPAPLGFSTDDFALEFIVGVVEDLRERDGGVRVEFARTYVGPPEFSCVPTESPRIRWAERVAEQRDCRGFSRTRIRPEPVQLAAGGSLEEGNLVEAWVDPQTRRAAIWRVYPDERSTSGAIFALLGSQ